MVTAKCSLCASHGAVQKLIRQQKTMHCSALCVLQQRVWVLSDISRYLFLPCLSLKLPSSSCGPVFSTEPTCSQRKGHGFAFKAKQPGLLRSR